MADPLLDRVILTRPVQIVVIMTEAFRERFIEEARAQLRATSEQVERLEALCPEEGGGPAQAELLRSERARLLRRVAEIEWRIREVEAVPLGSRLPFRRCEGPVELVPGDDFRVRMAELEVVLEDWRVVSIGPAGEGLPS